MFGRQISTHNSIFSTRTHSVEKRSKTGPLVEIIFFGQKQSWSADDLKSRVVSFPAGSDFAGLGRILPGRVGSCRVGSVLAGLGRILPGRVGFWPGWVKYWTWVKFWPDFYFVTILVFFRYLCGFREFFYKGVSERCTVMHWPAIIQTEKSWESGFLAKNGLFDPWNDPKILKNSKSWKFLVFGRQKWLSWHVRMSQKVWQSRRFAADPF